ncbi:MAG: helix-turn-helix domain-containing protein [Candidatus Methylomirabilota bacterium]|jgi:hypothetical protein
MTRDRELIPVSQRELHRYHTLRLVLERRMTGAQAATSLDLSLRHVRRLTSRLRHEGRRPLVHGNRSRPSGRRPATAPAACGRPRPACASSGMGVPTPGSKTGGLPARWSGR